MKEEFFHSVRSEFWNTSSESDSGLGGSVVVISGVQPFEFFAGGGQIALDDKFGQGQEAQDNTQKHE